MSRTPKYIAEIHDVREVTFVAAADLRYWEEHLRREHLFPQRVNGKAEVLVSAMESKWMGLPFRELCISVAVSNSDDRNSRDGYFLVAAFNSSRLLTFCERTFFHTPYNRGRIAVGTHPRCSFELGDRDGVILQAERSKSAAAPRISEELWEGKIFIPGDGRRAHSSGRYFCAKIGGRTEISPFAGATDVLQLSPLNSQAIVQWLLDCRLEGKEWHVRPNATHARSKTYNGVDGFER